ncbi:MAG: histidine kinase [Saprospiraceae bacterium]
MPAKYFFILLLIKIQCLAQAPDRLTFHHLSKENGLSNNDVYFMHRDSRGFLWLGTLNGLNRYDGSNVKVYKSPFAGIDGVNIKNIIEDRKGNLWVGSESSLNFYDRKLDKFSQMIPPGIDSINYSFPYAIDDHGLLWVVINKTLYTYNPATKQYNCILENTPDYLSAPQRHPFNSIKTIFTEGDDHIGLKKISIKDYKISRIEFFFNGTINQPVLKNINEYIYPENDSTVWLTGTPSGLIKFNPIRKVWAVFKHATIESFSKVVSLKDYLFIGSGKGLLVFDKITNQFIKLFKNNPTDPYSLKTNWNEGLYIDNENNLFLSQPGGFGVDFTNLDRPISEHWLDFSTASSLGFQDNHISFILNNQDLTYAKLQNDGTLVINKAGQVIKQFPGRTPLFCDSDQRTWLSNGRDFILVNLNNQIVKLLFFKDLAGQMGEGIYGMTETEKGYYLIVCNKGLFEIQESNATLHSVDEFNKKITPANSPIYYDKTTKRVYLCRNWRNEFSILEKKSEAWVLVKEWTPPFQINMIRSGRDKHKLWLGTNKGLALFDQDSMTYQLITEKDGLPDNAVYDIYEEPNGNYWLVSNGGISYYEFQKNKYQLVTSKQGAYSDEYDWNCCFKLTNERMVFGGTNGITVIPSSIFKEYTVKPKLEIIGMSANEKPLSTAEYIGESSKIEFYPDQKSFSFDLAGIDLAGNDALNIEYKLNGFDQQSIFAKNPATARYSNLPGGSYHFISKVHSGTVTSAEKDLLIVVHAPYYRSDWFKSLVFFLVLGISYLFYKARIKQIRLEAKNKLAIRKIRAEAEIDALRSQMKPHFIFNCLNTVDSYILHQRTQAASEYLNKFSKLIRRILENSNQEFIPLDEEISTIELYIKLEQERSHPKFEYEIHIDENLKFKDIYVPTLLIQPFVENALLHGLRHKTTGTGLLQIHVEVSNDKINFRIKDNGIGREKSSAINDHKNLSKKSLGLKISQERITKINELLPGQHAYLLIHDLKMDSGFGTEVEISIPILSSKLLYHDQSHTH